MAPVLHHKEKLDRLSTSVSRSVVILRSFKKKKGKYRKTHYDSCTGFIIHAERGLTFVAVNSLKIKKSDDLVCAYFHDGVMREATVFISGTNSGHTILEVQIEGRKYPKVGNGNNVTRDDVFILANVEDSGWNTFSSSVIIPDTAALCTRSMKQSDESMDMFALGCAVDLDIILGAPVFDFVGKFVGTMSSVDSAACDLMYARKASSFAKALVDTIKEKLGGSSLQGTSSSGSQ